MAFINSVTYNKTFSLGNYENEKIGFSANLLEDDDPVAVLKELKTTTEHAHQFTQGYSKYERMKQVAADPANHTGTQVEMAKRGVAEFESNFAQFLALDGSPRLPVPAKADDNNDEADYAETPY